jgi:hypothetical protein
VQGQQHEERDVNDQQPDAEQPIAWRAVPEDTPVRSADGEEVGTLADLLGSDVEDIFHGIVVRLGRIGREVFVPADSVTLLTTRIGPTTWGSPASCASGPGGSERRTADGRHARVTRRARRSSLAASRSTVPSLW